MEVPSIFAYLDFRTFMRDWLAARRKQDPRYTYTVFAEAGGCSKATVSNVLSGARSPRPETLDSFARAMDLAPDERNHLRLLVELSTVTALDQRWEVMEKILASSRCERVRWSEGEEQADLSRFLQHWYIPAIWELAGLPAFRADPTWIAATVCPPITVVEADNALRTLFELGFLEQTGERVVRHEMRFRTEPEAAERAALNFHQTVIPRLLRRIGETPPEERQVMAATLTVDPAMLPELKERLNQMVERMATVTDDVVSETSQRRVYQLTIQLLPVSETV